MTATSTDKIEREVLLKAPQSRVWKAISNAEEFGSWFGVALEGKTFEPGKPVSGFMTIKGYEHMQFKAVIDRVEPEHTFSYRWHPGAPDPDADYSAEPMTLVVFEIKEAEGGTLLKIVESGFDKVPAARRLEAFQMNSHGWDAQIRDIAIYVTKS